MPNRVKPRQAAGHSGQAAAPSNIVQPNITYAEALRPQPKPLPPPQPQESTNNIEYTLNNLMQMMMQFMATMQSTIQELVRNQNTLIESIKRYEENHSKNLR